MDLGNLSQKQKMEICSFGMGGLLALIAIVLFIGGDGGIKTIGASLFVASMVIAFLPYGLYSYFRDRKYNEMENEFPSFLRNLSESIKSGMSLPEAFQQASRTDYGKLNAEVERAAHQLSWGIPFPEVMHRMSNRITGSDLIQRAVLIVLQSYESGGNISETLDAIANNISTIKDAEKEKRSVLVQQVYIIYAIHFLFLGIIVALYLLLSGFILEIGGGGFGDSGPSAGGGMSGMGGMSFGEVPNFCGGSIVQPMCSLCPAFGLGDSSERICYYQALFMIMLVVEGVLNGLVAGEVLEGKLSAGVKHSMIMGVLGFFLYIVALNIL